MRSLSFALPAVLISAAWAQPIGQADAVDQVLARHPARAAAAHRVAAAEAGVDRVGAAWLPRIQAVGQVAARGPVPTLTIDTGLTVPGAAGPLVIERELGQTWTTSGVLEAGWRALDFGTRAARREAAVAGVAVARAEADARGVELAWAVRQAYLAERFFSEVARVNHKALKTAAADVARAEAELSAGLGAPVALAAARSRLAERRGQQAEADAGATRARSTLRLFLGLPANAPLELSDTLERLAAAPLAPAPEASPAIDHLRAASAAKAAEDAAVDATFWPTLDLFGSAGYADPQTFVQTEPGVIWQAGARLVWPLFDGDARRRQRRQIAAERAGLGASIEAAAEARARAQADADVQIKAAGVAASTAAERVRAARLFLTAAQAGLEAGVATSLEVEAAQDRIDGAHLAVTRAWFDAARARADRLQADGVAQEPRR